MDDHLTINRRHWDERAAPHAASPEYAFEEFARDPAHLSEVVRFDRGRLGDLHGRRGVHLQCHIGTDTLSLSRLGATMSGLDFSGESLVQARRLARATDTEIDFHQADVYDAVEVFGREQFDLVFTGIGALCWLPDIARWAEVVADLLRPGGQVFIREGHPMLWALDENADPPAIRYSYFEQEEPLVDDSEGTYVTTDVVLDQVLTHTWNHGIGEVITALLGRGLRLTGFVEHDSVPWNALPGRMAMDATGEWRLAEHPERLAASYTLQATKPRGPGAQ